MQNFESYGMLIVKYIRDRYGAIQKFLVLLFVYRKLRDIKVLSRQEKMFRRFAGHGWKHPSAFPLSRKNKFKKTGSHDACS